ncbi:exported hypothetical protein [Burkholderiales bacterium]|nr:exported hypothetical protein [Burkholderiales bacterium]
MDDQQKTFLLLALIIAILFYAGGTHAEAAVPVMDPGAATALVASEDQSSKKQAAMHEIGSAARRLEQATLQWDFSSNSQELALLQSAHDRLASAIKSLCCAQRVRAVELLTDIEFVMARASARLDPSRSATGASYGPPAPSRDQLAQLTTEAQDLARGTPGAHRLLDAGNRDLPSQNASNGRSAREPEPIDDASTDPLRWPPGRPETAPQFHFRF